MYRATRVLLSGALSAVALSTVMSCSTMTPSPTWSGDGLHAVDGYWILAEQPCDPASDELCAALVTAAESALDIGQTLVVHTATTALPVLKSVRADGQVRVYLHNSTGPVAFVILDLADGSRRVVGVGCVGVPNPDGSRYCARNPFDDYRVGAVPSF
jgi:hypothetical protein